MCAFLMGAYVFGFAGRQPQLSHWQGHPLKYSELLKTLKSVTKRKPLPNKIVEWLKFKCLALLAVPRKSNGDEADKYESEVVTAYAALSFSAL